MRNIIFLNGLIAGTIVIITIIIGMYFSSQNDTTQFSTLLGYLVMIISLSLIFLAIKRYRDSELGGVIKFGTAFKIGIGITLVASLVYIVGWEINLALTDYNFMEEYAAYELEKREAAGLSGEQLEAERARIEDAKAMYQNPLFRIPITFVEIFPVGLFISLLSSFLLRNSKFMPVA